jgi:hypothetical protein
MAKQDEQLEGLTAGEQAQQGADVAAAGAAAASAEPDPKRKRAVASRAIRERAQDYRLSEAEADMIADALLDKMEARGAFDSPPEPVIAPSVAAAAAPAAAPAAADATQPRRRTFAERFRGA